jgi:hypothetical protein
MNPNIASAPKTSARTPVGRFFRDLPKFSRDRVPPELLDLYDWCKSLDTKQVDYLLELKNLSQVLKTSMIPPLIDKLSHGETLNKRELDTLRLLKDILEASHKLKYGDRKVIEKIVTIEDVRKAIFSDKKVIDAEVCDATVSQDMDRS